jgi:hypothetical protein
MEQRKETRRRLFKDAKIGFGGRLFRTSCLVHNISSSGAKLVLRRPADLPAEFILSISALQVACLVKTRWQQDNVIGVEITQPSLADTL